MLWTLVACANNPRVVDTLADVMDARGVETLNLATTSENVVIAGTDDAEIAISVELTTTRASTAKDDKARDSLHIELRDEGNGQARGAVWFDRSIAHYATDVAVFLPRTIELSLIDDDGALHVENVGALDLDDRDGDVEIVGVARDATILDKDGNVDVSAVGGDLRIEDGDGDIHVRDAAGVVTIEDGAGDIVVENALKVRVESDTSGEVTVK